MGGRELQPSPDGGTKPSRGQCAPSGQHGGAGAAGAKAPLWEAGAGAGRAGGGVRERDASRIQTSGACRVRSGGCKERGCTGRGCRADSQPGAAMVKISFQPAVAGIKGDKADKASASAPAPGPAAEILLTPARVRAAGSSGGERGT